MRCALSYNGDVQNTKLEFILDILNLIVLSHILKEILSFSLKFDSTVVRPECVKFDCNM